MTLCSLLHFFQPSEWTIANVNFRKSKTKTSNFVNSSHKPKRDGIFHWFNRWEFWCELYVTRFPQWQQKIEMGFWVTDCFSVKAIWLNSRYGTLCIASFNALYLKLLYLSFSMELNPKRNHSWEKKNYLFLPRYGLFL